MGIEADIDVAIRRQDQSRSLDRMVAAVATSQHGLVTRAQLRHLGLGASAVDRRVRAGRLHVVHRGVYAVGHAALTRRGRWLAAVFAAGPGAVLSHRSAAALWGIRQTDWLEVTAERQRRLPAPITAHQAKLLEDETTTIDGIPTTTIHRTLLDLAATLPRSHLERAMAEAERQRLTDPLPLSALIARHRGRRGIQTIKAITNDRTPPGRSELERRFRRLARKHGLPRPEANRLVCGFECDIVWPEQRLIVELDGREHHHTTAAFENDRARDRTLAAAGWLVIRVTWRQLHDDPQALVTDLRRLLTQRSTA